jgi:hypothetical protein
MLVQNPIVNGYSIDPSEFRTGDQMTGGESGHVNLIGSPFKKVNTGVEFMYLSREDTDGVLPMAKDCR